MTVETMAAFARRLGIRKSYVHRLKTEGRLVLTEDGLVDVEQSMQRIHDTGGARPDVAERFAKLRGRPVMISVSSADEGNSGRNAEADNIGNSYQTARAVKEKYLALQAKLDYEQKLGKLLLQEDVDYALNAFATTVRVKAEALPDQLAPVVVPITDIGHAHAVLTNAIRKFLEDVAEETRRTSSELYKSA